MATEPSRNLEQAKRLELGLVLVRWFGVALGAYLVSQTNTGDPRYFPRASNIRIDIGYAIIAVLALANFLVWLGCKRVKTERAFRRLGALAFGVDTAVVLGMAWLYSYDPRGSTWVVIYILPLEGAIRYRLEGAVAAVGISLVSEAFREGYLASAFTGYAYLFSNVAFRVGIQGIIALVAGFMARSMAREADRATQEAARFQEAAAREGSARRELAAFNTAILTGVAAEDLDTSIQLMAGAIGRNLGFETFIILLREQDALVVKGMYGMPFYQDRIPIGQGVTGTVAATGRPLLVKDVKAFPDYIEVDPEMRAEMAAPLRIGDEIIGVVDVEGRYPLEFDDAALAILVRLADQIALVAHSNLLLSRQRETMERLQELDQMKSDFVAITSHELRTPITAIRGFVKTLLRNRDRLSPDQVASFMTIIDRQSSRLARLVDDLLLVSRIEAGTIRFSLEEVDLEAFLRETVEALGPERRGRIQVEVTSHEHPVVVDPQRLEQILRNLIENALKFSHIEAPVEVRGALLGDRIELSVTDHGVGIPPEAIPHVFERFHQVGEVLTREAEGAGLGLYITKRLIEAMGGTISVQSVVGEGSTFTVSIPANLQPGDGGAVDFRGSKTPRATTPA